MNYFKGNEVSIMAETKEKQYVSDNAQLMAEWDWEKNNELNISPIHFLMVRIRMFGGNAQKVTDGTPL